MAIYRLTVLSGTNCYSRHVHVYILTHNLSYIQEIVALCHYDVKLTKNTCVSCDTHSQIITDNTCDLGITFLQSCKNDILSMLTLEWGIKRVFIVIVS